MSVIYISGLYTAKSHSEIANNIKKAEKWAVHFWNQGYAVICPHLNTRHFEKYEAVTNINYERIMIGYLDILARLRHHDRIFMMKGWKKSKGAVREHKAAKKKGIKIIYE